MKSKTIQRLMTQARIDQLCQSLDREEMTEGSRNEWRALAMHFRAQADEARGLLRALDNSVRLRRTAQHFERLSIEDVLDWAEKQKSQIKKP